MAEIILTADRATLSSYHDNLYLGFLSCLPDRLCPEFIYKRMVTPIPHDADGTVTLPNLSLRAVEAACLAGGQPPENIQILHDSFLESKITKATRIVGISTHDPLGFGPATTTWSSIFKGTPYNRIYFLRLMDRVKTLKKKFGFTVVVGGPGGWQVSDPETMDALGLDYVVFGEGEIAAPKLFGALLRGDPPDDRHVSDRAPAADEIRPVRGPSAHHLIEITRGCGRGCDFCASTSAGDFRTLPLEKILGDLRTYLKTGIRSVSYHSDDALRYGSTSFLAEKDGLLNLFAKSFEAGAKQVWITHASFVNIALQPDVIGALTRLLNEHGIGNFGCQPGLETGSARLIARHMKGKVYPRDPKDWNEVICRALEVMRENRWFAVCTLICGLPEERAEDIRATTDLIRKVGKFEALYIPLFFAPLGLTRFQDREKFVADHMLREHWELMLACWDHNFRHIYKMYRLYASEDNPAFRALIRSLIAIMKGWVDFRRGAVLRQLEKRMKQ